MLLSYLDFICNPKRSWYMLIWYCHYNTFSYFLPYNILQDIALLIRSSDMFSRNVNYITTCTWQMCDIIANNCCSFLKTNVSKFRTDNDNWKIAKMLVTVSQSTTDIFKSCFAKQTFPNPKLFTLFSVAGTSEYLAFLFKKWHKRFIAYESRCRSINQSLSSNNFCSSSYDCIITF